MIRSWFEITTRGPANKTEPVAALLIKAGSPGILEEDEGSEKIIKAYIPADSSLNQNRVSLKRGLKKFGWTYKGRLFENLDWLSKWKEHIEPISISHRLIIKPTWKEVEQKRGRIIVEIDPGMAFGTGSHASTMMCLKAADRLSHVIKRRNVLDVGTGSGILAIAAAKFGAEKAVGFDIDLEALKVARKNVRLNNVSRKVTITAKSLENIKSKFSVIFANIIAEELVRIAHLLKARIEKKGFLILSGILQERVEEVKIAYKRSGFRIFKAYTKGEWVCLVFQLS